MVANVKVSPVDWSPFFLINNNARYTFNMSRHCFLKLNYLGNFEKIHTRKSSLLVNETHFEKEWQRKKIFWRARFVFGGEVPLPFLQFPTEAPLSEALSPMSYYPVKSGRVCLDRSDVKRGNAPTRFLLLYRRLVTGPEEAKVLAGLLGFVRNVLPPWQRLFTCHIAQGQEPQEGSWNG